MKRRICLTFIVLIVIFLATGCGGVPSWQRDDPEEVFKGFLQFLDAHDVTTACEFLSHDTRKTLEERAKTLGPEYSRTGCDLLRPGHIFSSTREYKKIELSSATDKEAVVSIVMHDGSSLPIVMHREQDRWSIDLPLQTTGEK